jgi:hypothetical protein
VRFEPLRREESLEELIAATCLAKGQSSRRTPPPRFC